MQNILRCLLFRTLILCITFNSIQAMDLVKEISLFQPYDPLKELIMAAHLPDISEEEMRSIAETWRPAVRSGSQRTIISPKTESAISSSAAAAAAAVGAVSSSAIRSSLTGVEIGHRNNQHSMRSSISDTKPSDNKPSDNKTAQHKSSSSKKNQSPLFVPEEIIAQAESFETLKKVLITIIEKQPHDTAEIKRLIEAKYDPSSFHELFLTAAELGKFSVVTHLIDAHGVSVNAQNKKGETALMRSIIAGEQGMVTYLLEKKAHVDAQDAQGMTALMYAVMSGNQAFVEQLFMYGADANIQNVKRWPALILAVFFAQKHLIPTLLNHGAQLHQPHEKRSVLEIAWAAKKFEELKVLLEYAESNQEHFTQSGKTLLIFAITEGNREIAHKLIQKKIPVHFDYQGISPLMVATNKGYTEIVQMLIRGGAFNVLTLAEKKEITMLATSSDKKDIVELFITSDSSWYHELKAADIRFLREKFDTWRRTDLLRLLPDNDSRRKSITSASKAKVSDSIEDILRSKERYQKKIKLLIQKLVKEPRLIKDIQKQLVSTFGRYACIDLLSQAALISSIDIVRLIVREGFLLPEIGIVLCEVAHNGSLEMAKEILKLGAQIDAHDNKGKTPLMRACEAGRADMAELLLSKNADINRSSKDGWTALMWAVIGSHIPLVQLLLEFQNSHGIKIDVNARTLSGCTPLMVAADNGYEEIMILLLAANADINKRDNKGWPVILRLAFLDLNQTDAIKLRNTAESMGWPLELPPARRIIPNINQLQRLNLVKMLIQARAVEPLGNSAREKLLFTAVSEWERDDIVQLLLEIPPKKIDKVRDFQKRRARVIMPAELAASDFNEFKPRRSFENKSEQRIMKAKAGSSPYTSPRAESPVLSPREAANGAHALSLHERMSLILTNECVICLDDTSLDANRVHLSCTCIGKYYHRGCIEEYFESRNDCPTCRQAATIAE